MIFLDISGTLDPLTGQEGRPEGDVVDRRVVVRVNRIGRATGAKVVISSDWVADPAEYPRICQMLVYHGLEPEIVGQTTQPLGHHIGERATHIQNWLDERPVVTNYVILDDMRLAVGHHREHWAQYPRSIVNPESKLFVPDIPGMIDHFVWVDANVGVTDENADEAIAILQR